MRTRFILSVSVFLGLSGASMLPLAAQNLVPNGNFQASTTSDDLWDGVDGDGILAGNISTMTGLNTDNHLAEVAIPLSVSVGDLNGDGLPDIMTADTTGYYRIYFNSGTKTQPKFTHAEIVPLFFGRGDPGPESLNVVTTFHGPRIDLHDMQGRGGLDIVAGFYGGQMMVIPNSGGRTSPNYRQPPSLKQYLFPTSSQGQIWANLLAPAVVDWNKDTRPDILVGDGSYSANSIFLLLNEGSGPQPKFSETSRSYLVYGNGRTQLSPTIADYNGDGLPDVIVADHTGKVTVNLNEPNAKLGRPLEKSTVITFGGSDSLRQAVTVKAADLNGDGLFDLVFGKANGRVAMALNKGTKEQPQFGAVEDVKGEDIFRRDVKLPSNWAIDTGFLKGNYFSRVTVVDPTTDPASAAPSGKTCLRISYDQPPNKIVQFPPMTGRSGDAKTGLYFSDFGQRTPPVDSSNSACPVTSVMLKVNLRSVLPGVPYDLSFNFKGGGASGEYALICTGHGALSERKVTKGERGSGSAHQDVAVDHDQQQATFSPAQNWATIKRSITFQFNKAHELNDPAKWKGVGKPSYEASIYLRVDLQPFAGVCYIDNVQFAPKAK